MTQPVHLLSIIIILFGLTAVVVPNQTAAAQETGNDETILQVDEDEKIETPEKVEVKPVTVDADISERLKRIFAATGWFDGADISTDEGVVFLSGIADSNEHREWAERVAQRTSDVVAVVNRMEVQGRSFWDIEPAYLQLYQLGRDFIQLLPLLVVGTVIVFVSYVLANLAASLTRKLVGRKIDSQLLQQVMASLITVLVLLIGIYIALKVSGLSRLAVTVLGGTGLVGLALGFAFRDIAENYLSSVLISLNRPFRVGDLIELEGNKGFVRRVTTRGTLLLTTDGNHIQIPNSTVYKSVITNYSSSPRVRKEFQIGIGYEDSVTEAQRVVHRTLTQHGSVLHDPEPLVLVKSLGASTVNLVTRFWLDAERFDADSVCSALMRQTKTALTDAKISMPDEAREVVFPSGVPVAMIDDQPDLSIGKNATLTEPQRTVTDDADKSRVSSGEGNLENTDDTIQQHAESVEERDVENLIN